MTAKQARKRSFCGRLVIVLALIPLVAFAGEALEPQQAPQTFIDLYWTVLIALFMLVSFLIGFIFKQSNARISALETAQKGAQTVAGCQLAMGMDRETITDLTKSIRRVELIVAKHFGESIDQ